MRKASLTVAACATLLCAGTALATTPQQICDTARVKAWIKYQACVEKVVAKDAGGVIFDEFAAFAKCRHKYFGKWTAFQSITGSTCIGSRYANNGDQTETDYLSGLVWEKKDNLGGIHDKDNLYTWSTGAPYKENGTAFGTFLGFLILSNFAGSSGWRLPMLAELQTIVLDFECKGVGGSPTCICPSSPCVDPALDAGNIQSGFYWSATGYVPSSDLAWFVVFIDGNAFPSTKTTSNYVRAVRGGL